MYVFEKISKKIIIRINNLFQNIDLSNLYAPDGMYLYIMI